MLTSCHVSNKQYLRDDTVSSIEAKNLGALVERNNKVMDKRSKKKKMGPQEQGHLNFRHLKHRPL
jgi:hypothetical protein